MGLASLSTPEPWKRSGELEAVGLAVAPDRELATEVLQAVNTDSAVTTAATVAASRLLVNFHAPYAVNSAGRPIA
jgi:hypothetical protein